MKIRKMYKYLMFPLIAVSMGGCEIEDKVDYIVVPATRTIRKINYAEANGFDVILKENGSIILKKDSSIKNRSTHYELTIGRLAGYNSNFMGGSKGIIWATDVDGDKNIDNLQIYGGSEINDLRELASVNKLSEIEKKLLDEL